MNTRLRRTAATLAAGLLVAGLVDVTLPSSASAATTVLKVVGTTDVTDSGLMANIIEKDFEAANQDVDLQYTAQGTGAAIASAQGGDFSALLVHAASVENKFVNDGYSYEKDSSGKDLGGRSLFWGDYILVGPKSDPAGVLVDGQPSHDVVGALEKIAAAGAQTKATLVSRGGNPGTTIQEHALWALSTVDTCTVPPGSLGGGAAPAVAPTVGQTCAAKDSDRKYPPWYQVSGSGQAGNLSIANECNFASSPGGTPNCYAFLDRGTFAYQQSQGNAQGLTIVARDNAASSRGNEAALVNAFHGYVVNPAKISNNQINTALGTKFLDFLTSPEEQKKIGVYLGTGRAAGFIPAAAPLVSNSALPTSVTEGSRLTITGSIRNAIPGYPNLDGVSVTLLSKTGGSTTESAPATTGPTGGFTFSDVPVNGTTTFTIKTPPINKVEDVALNFFDQITASTQELGTVATTPVVTPPGETPPVVTPPVVTPDTSPAPAAISLGQHKLKRRTLRVAGSLSPGAQGAAPALVLYRARPGKQLKAVASRPLAAGATSYSATFRFPRGTWVYRVAYTSPGSLTIALTTKHRIRVR